MDKFNVVRLSAEAYWGDDEAGVRKSVSIMVQTGAFEIVSEEGTYTGNDWVLTIRFKADGFRFGFVKTSAQYPKLMFLTTDGIKIIDNLSNGTNKKGFLCYNDKHFMIVDSPSDLTMLKIGHLSSRTGITVNLLSGNSYSSDGSQRKPVSAKTIASSGELAKNKFLATTYMYYDFAEAGYADFLTAPYYLTGNTLPIAGTPIILNGANFMVLNGYLAVPTL